MFDAVFSRSTKFWLVGAITYSLGGNRNSSCEGLMDCTTERYMGNSINRPTRNSRINIAISPPLEPPYFFLDFLALFMTTVLSII